MWEILTNTAWGVVGLFVIVSASYAVGWVFWYRLGKPSHTSDGEKFGHVETAGLGATILILLFLLNGALYFLGGSVRSLFYG